MSRIHDALKKAEQERGTAVSADATISGEVVPIAPLPVSEELDPAFLPLEPRVGGSRSLQTLLEDCRVGKWDPDKEKLLFVDSQNGLGTEEFRSLRTRLYRMRQKQPLRTLLISSAIAAEGKTLVCANLAQTIVHQRGRKVLLIDADLRHPSLHRMLGAPSSPGLTDYLRGEADEFDIVQRGSNEDLFLIPSGKVASNPTELLGTGRLETLLQRISSLFEWILVDSPPVTPVSDAVMLADMTDGVILVLRSAVTPMPLAQKAQQELRNRPLLGVVLNCADIRAGYGSYYYSHYKPGPNGHDGRDSDQ